MIHRICLALSLCAICGSALVTFSWAGPPRTASGRVIPYGEKDPYAGVPDILSPRLEFTFDTAGGEIRGSFQGESRKLHRGIDDLLVCVRAAGTFRATFQPQRSGEVSGKAVFSAWQVTVYKMDGERGTRDTSQWTTDWLRRQEYLAPPADAAFYGSLLLESGKGSGAISADRHFMVQWEVTFPPSSGEQPDAPAAHPPATTAMPPAPQILREFYVTRLEADRERYASGEPVELTVALERWAEVRQQDGSHASLPQGTIEGCSFDLVLTFPHGANPSVPQSAELRVAANKPHRLRPFAPIVPGEYSIQAWPALGKSPEDRYYAVNQKTHGSDAALRASVTIRCIELDAAQRSSLAGRMDQIISRYRQQVPSNRAAVKARVDEEIAKRLPVPFLEPLPFLAPSDMEYGSLNNALFGDNSFTCDAYCGSVLKFLNQQHFRSENRQLFVGVHYGPLLRGFRASRAPLLFGEHYGVVLYPAGTAYDDDSNRVLDPWPRQEPAVFSLKDFRWFYGWWFAVGAAVGVEPDPSRASWFPDASVNTDRSAVGFPTHGSPVFWNLEWSPLLSPHIPPDKPAPPPEKPVGPVPRPDSSLYCLLMCPATLTITDRQGRCAGLHEGKLDCTIPQCQLFGCEKAGGESTWCIGLPAAEYDVRVTGTSQGTFQLIVAAGNGAAHYYAAPIQRGETASLQIAPGRLDTPLTLADGRRLPPRPLGPDTGRAPRPTIRAIRDQVTQLSFPDDAVEEEQAADEPAGWAKSPVDPTRIVGFFPSLRLRPGYVLRAYVFREDGNANGVVWALPADAEFPEPEDCPKLENHLLRAPKPWDAIDDVMEAIEGDGSQWSYVAASLLRRELAEFGARGHGCRWSLHAVLEQDPFRDVPADESDPGLDRPTTPASQWEWTEPQPRDWAPQVRMEQDRVTVTFYTYCGLETQTIYRHTDIYRPGKYRPRVAEQKIATGGPGFLP